MNIFYRIMNNYNSYNITINQYRNSNDKYYQWIRFCCNYYYKINCIKYSFTGNFAVLHTISRWNRGHECNVVDLCFMCFLHVHFIILTYLRFYLWVFFFTLLKSVQVVPDNSIALIWVNLCLISWKCIIACSCKL